MAGDYHLPAFVASRRRFAEGAEPEPDLAPWAGSSFDRGSEADMLEMQALAWGARSGLRPIDYLSAGRKSGKGTGKDAKSKKLPVKPPPPPPAASKCPDCPRGCTATVMPSGKCICTCPPQPPGGGGSGDGGGGGGGTGGGGTGGPKYVVGGCAACAPACCSGVCHYKYGSIGGNTPYPYCLANGGVFFEGTDCSPACADGKK